jgi:hypothetical protein
VLLPTMGGQTALNTALTLNRLGILAKWDVEMIGAKAPVIDKAEDRELFREAMTRIGLETPRSMLAHDVIEALQAIDIIGLPAIIRPSFTRGTGGGTPNRGISGDHRARPDTADQRGPGRGSSWKEYGGGRRPRRQLHHRLLDREHRSEGVHTGDRSSWRWP